MRTFLLPGMCRRVGLKAIAAAAMLLALSWQGVAGAMIPAENLLANPGAEAGPSGHGKTIPIPGWITSPQARSSFSSDDYGDVDRLSQSVSAAVGGGKNYFWGGPDNRDSSATQVVDVSMAGAEIDADKVRVTLAAQLGGYQKQNDVMRIEASFLNASGGAIAGGIVLKGPNAAERGNRTELVPKSASANVPAGTRSIQVTMISTRTDGSNNDGYADNLSLVLGAQSPHP